jgi:hypothetical protein
MTRWTYPGNGCAKLCNTLVPANNAWFPALSTDERTTVLTTEAAARDPAAAKTRVKGEVVAERVERSG